MHNGAHDYICEGVQVEWLRQLLLLQTPGTAQGMCRGRATGFV